MKNKKYHDVGTVQISNQNIAAKEKKLIPLTHLYMIAHFLCLLQAFPLKWMGLN